MLVSTRFQVFSLPARGAFHLSLSVLIHYRSPVVFSLGRWSARIQPEFLVLRPTRESLNGAASLSPTGLSPSTVGFPNTVRLDMRFVTPRIRCGRYINDPSTPLRATTAVLHAYGLGLSPFAHHYSGNLIRFLFLRLLRCFTSPGSPRLKRVTGLLPAGFPHSGISGSMVACASPKLFAACHALHRPLVPRHPPCALCTLTSLISFIHYSVVKVPFNFAIIAAQKNGGDDRIRTDDFLRARQALSH